MSRWRLEAKLRVNAEYKALTAWLTTHGYAWDVVKRNATGHPELAITLADGRVLHQTISSTPMGGVNTSSRLARLKRALRSAGAYVD